MTKIKMFAGVVGAVALMLPVAAAASTNISALTLNGLSNNTYSVGDVANAKLTFDLTGTSQAESMAWEVVGSGIPKTCVDIQDRTTSGTFTTLFDIDTSGATEGTWDVKVYLYADNGLGANNNCAGSPSDTMNFNNRITLTQDINGGNSTSNNTGGQGNSGATGSNSGSTSGSGSSASNGGSSGFDWDTFFDKFCTKFPNACGTPATSTPVCSQLTAALVGTQPGVYSGANASLQTFLMSHGGVIPALTPPSTTVPGFYGSQTANAVWQVKTANHCI